MRIAIITTILIVFFCSCQNKSRQAVDFKKEIFFSGIFVKEEKFNDKQNKLYLKNGNGEIVEFISMPFFDKTEEKYLRNDGKPNVTIVYEEFYNPVRKRTENIVKMITPAYGKNQ
jgi:hypothetical protein